ncbi:Lipoprotein NlpE [Bacteroides pyogenes]|uniref:Copper resistance protein NlpE n=2 Tax=Bacteroides pyogenes TaxID=310300 RepID=A0A5D3FHM1_9BACE|nr:copper resistance protein NlpE [Bacteroides pyogenes]GAE22767.1 lipoprotein [Bacteroides pyogenes JCM 10003]ERI85314.1 hypothetical protein HMPREF1981_01871 [Bacteroides pyogenes F0041]MBB3895498.1 putative lipoprotein NlpE involved in copper resistance [Bacteroides pyogenes]MBR8704985.1 Lipoprotein NlpE [Bacteroides pyogenes]MBR8721477.1 Lipoprotein NlpE [Bacteroides pyogenes]
MKAMKLILAGAVVFAMASCTGSQKKTDASQQDSVVVVTDAQTVVKVADIAGTYEGTLPCADCPGIKTTLKINDDTTYDLRSEYLEKKDGVFEESGTFNLLEGNVIELVTPSSGDKTYYKVLENAVALSDKEGTLNDGELAEHYILKKQ